MFRSSGAEVGSAILCRLFVEELHGTRPRHGEQAATADKLAPPGKLTAAGRFLRICRTSGAFRKRTVRWTPVPRTNAARAGG
jgi:hypothetical protein